MIFTIDRKEKYAFEQSCATFSLKANFYTNENNPNVLKLEVTHEDGSGLIAEEGYLVGRMVGGTLLVDKLNAMI